MDGVFSKQRTKKKNRLEEIQLNGITFPMKVNACLIPVKLSEQIGQK